MTPPHAKASGGKAAEDDYPSIELLWTHEWDDPIAVEGVQVVIGVFRDSGTNITLIAPCTHGSAFHRHYLEVGRQSNAGVELGMIELKGQKKIQEEIKLPIHHTTGFMTGITFAQELSQRDLRAIKAELSRIAFEDKIDSQRLNDLISTIHSAVEHKGEESE